jgi:hypothetical protein
VVNDGFHDLIEVFIPQGTILRPVRPAAVSCRTHLLGRVMDVMQALFGQRNPAYRCAAGFSDSPHLFYSGFKPTGEWFLLYQVRISTAPKDFTESDDMSRLASVVCQPVRLAMVPIVIVYFQLSSLFPQVRPTVLKSVIFLADYDSREYRVIFPLNHRGKRIS